MSSKLTYNCFSRERGDRRAARPAAGVGACWRRARAMLPLEKVGAPMTNDFPIVDALRVKAEGDVRLWLRFSDGSEGVYDMAAILAESGEMVEPLKAPAYFARVFVELGAPTWPNGFDLDPTNLYMELRAAGALKQVAPA